MFRAMLQHGVAQATTTVTKMRASTIAFERRIYYWQGSDATPNKEEYTSMEHKVVELDGLLGGGCSHQWVVQAPSIAPTQQPPALPNNVA